MTYVFYLYWIWSWFSILAIFNLPHLIMDIRPVSSNIGSRIGWRQWLASVVFTHSPRCAWRHLSRWEILALPEPPTSKLSITVIYVGKYFLYKIHRFFITSFYMPNYSQIHNIYARNFIVLSFGIAWIYVTLRWLPGVVVEYAIATFNRFEKIFDNECMWV